jgi:hypothetical protein
MTAQCRCNLRQNQACLIPSQGPQNLLREIDHSFACGEKLYLIHCCDPIAGQIGGGIATSPQGHHRLDRWRNRSNGLPTLVSLLFERSRLGAYCSSAGGNCLLKFEISINCLKNVFGRIIVGHRT